MMVKKTTFIGAVIIINKCNAWNHILYGILVTISIIFNLLSSNACSGKTFCIIFKLAAVGFVFTPRENVLLIDLDHVCFATNHAIFTLDTTHCVYRSNSQLDRMHLMIAAYELIYGATFISVSFYFRDELQVHLSCR